MKKIAKIAAYLMQGRNRLKHYVLRKLHRKLPPLEHFVDQGNPVATLGKRSILIMAGGTGGHVFPGLAIARVLQQQGMEVFWLGTHKGMEQEWVPKHSIPLYSLHIHGLRGRGWRGWFAAPWRLMRACFEAWRVLHRIKPYAVLGMGGFASGPGGLMAWLLRIPLYIHEQNAVAGLTNRILAKGATRVFSAFPNVFPERIHAYTTGNPVRESLTRLPAPQVRLTREFRPLRILVLGGSQGAQCLNQVIPYAIAQFPQHLRPEVWHQTGKIQHLLTESLYQELNCSARVMYFIEDMAEAYGWADLVIARAGALTVTELMVVGVPSILVPYAHAVDNHQHRNAEYLQQLGAAILFPQANLHADVLFQQLSRLQEDRSRLIDMAQAAYRARNPHAAEQIATDMLESLALLYAQKIRKIARDN